MTSLSPLPVRVQDNPGSLSLSLTLITIALPSLNSPPVLCITSFHSPFSHSFSHSLFLRQPLPYSPCPTPHLPSLSSPPPALPFATCTSLLHCFVWFFFQLGKTKQNFHQILFFFFFISCLKIFFLDRGHRPSFSETISARSTDEKGESRY